MSRDLNVDQIKKLWILDLIIQQGSLRKAALRAKVSPSAISQSLSALENMVGKPLLIRDRGSITPTQEALSILEVVRPAFDAFDRLQALSHAPLPKMSWLNFGTYESIAINILPGLTRRLREKMPHLRLSLRISRTDQLISMVRKGELCSALVTETDNLERFYVKEVADDFLGFFVARKNSISELGWQAAARYGVGTISQSKDGLPRYFSKFHRQLGSIRPSIVSDSFEALRCVAVAGNIVSVLPHRVAMRDDSLIEIFPGDKKPKEKLGHHRMLVVSQINCDRAEADYIATESQSLLNG